MDEFVAERIGEIRVALTQLRTANAAQARVVTVDGPSYCGKGHVAKAMLWTGFKYLDTGLLYRRLAYDTQELIISTNFEEIVRAALAMEKALIETDALFESLDQAFLRTHDISIRASILAAYPKIQASMIRIQQHWIRTRTIKEEGCILDGRNTGTAVWPTAQVRIVVDADHDIRCLCAKEYLRYMGRGTYELGDLDQSIRRRDSSDRSRAYAPLCVPHDAYHLDFSKLMKLGLEVGCDPDQAMTKLPACMQNIRTALAQLLMHPPDTLTMLGHKRG